jgi:hypothetical protein
MMHYTCDLCAKELADEPRYVVKIEAFAAHDPDELTDADLEDEHMEAVSQAIQEMEETGAEVDLTPTTKHFRHDLCEECYQRFLNDPLGRDHAQKVVFSKN